MPNTNELTAIKIINNRFKRDGYPFGGLFDGLVDDFRQFSDWNYVPISANSRLHRILLFALHSNVDKKSTLQMFSAWQYFSKKRLEYCMLQGDEKVTFELPNGTLTFPHLPRDSQTITRGELIIGMWSAVLYEDLDFAKLLYAYLGQPNVDGITDLDKIYINLTASLFNFIDADPMDLIQNYVDGIKDLPNSDYSNVITCNYLPSLDVMMKVFGGGSEVEYQRSMHFAVQNYHEFWRRPGFDEDLPGHLSVVLTTLAKVAYFRHGYTLGFETDYVPELLYKNQVPELCYDFIEKHASQS